MTTGEQLSSRSSVSNTTALDHIQNIVVGGGPGRADNLVTFSKENPTIIIDGSFNGINFDTVGQEFSFGSETTVSFDPSIYISFEVE
jgi:hypothetical protein